MLRAPSLINFRRPLKRANKGKWGTFQAQPYNVISMK
jgi:hypothetical protein